MNTKKIDDQIRDYYESQGPAPHTVARLKQMIRGGAPVRQRRRTWIGIAAALAIALTTLIWTAAHRVESPQQLAAKIARQAAVGHNEKQELEFRVASCAELQREMKSLDFTPVEPTMMHGMNMRVVGARYTTIEGKMAVQIVLVDTKGVPCTLYEVRPDETLARLPKSDHQVDGVQVSVWREKGLLMVLARPIA